MQTNCDTSERRFEVECKLEAELASLEALKEAQEQSTKLTNSMVAILSSLEDRLATLRRTILPVYNETGNLQTQQHNIEKTLAILDHAIGYYGVCQEVEASIRAGPNGTDGLDGFLESMNRLYNAQRYFQKNNPSSVELENVSTLFGTGLEFLYTEFNDILARQSKPVLPILLLDLIGLDEDTSSEDAPQSLCQLPDNVLADLVKISGWLEERGHRRHTKIYSTVRSAIVLRSLQLMKEHQRSASGGSTHAASPMPRTKFAHRHSLSSVAEGAGRRASRRLQQALEKKASKMLLKASQTTGLSFPSSRKSAASPAGHHGHNDDAAPVDEQEMENYLLLAAGLHKLMQAERVLIGRILPTTLQLQVLEATVRDAMDLVAHDGENIASRAKRCIARKDFTAVLVIFPILKHLIDLKPDLERTVEGCEYALRSKFASVIQTLTDTGAQALESFGDSVRNESGSVLPKDGTVAESTSNTLIFLEQLTEYTDTVGSVLKRHNETIDSAAIKVSIQNENQCRIALGQYIKRVLSLLNFALVSKSDTLYSDPALRALFRLNNHNYEINALRRSALMELLLLTEPSAEQTYLDLLARDRVNYVTTTFAKARSYIEHNDDPGSKVLKERFSGFTREFEESAKFQRTYAVPDSQLREELRKELRKSLVPLYTTFYHKYRHTSFSKNPTKYIKYSPEQVSTTIDTFFDTAA